MVGWRHYLVERPHPQTADEDGVEQRRDIVEGRVAHTLEAAVIEPVELKKDRPRGQRADSHEKELAHRMA